MEAIVFIIFQIFFGNARNFENWGISSDIPQFQLGNIRPRDAFRPIARERKYLMDSKNEYYVGDQINYLFEVAMCYLRCHALRWQLTLSKEDLEVVDWMK